MVASSNKQRQIGGVATRKTRSGFRDKIFCNISWLINARSQLSLDSKLTVHKAIEETKKFLKAIPQ